MGTQKVKLAGGQEQ